MLNGRSYSIRSAQEPATTWTNNSFYKVLETISAGCAKEHIRGVSVIALHGPEGLLGLTLIAAEKTKTASQLNGLTAVNWNRHRKTAEGSKEGYAGGLTQCCGRGDANERENENPKEGFL